MGWFIIGAMDTNYLTTSQVAAAVPMDGSTISRWVKEGRVTPAFRLPGRRGTMMWTADVIDVLRAEMGYTPEQAS